MVSDPSAATPLVVWQSLMLLLIFSSTCLRSVSNAYLQVLKSMLCGLTIDWCLQECFHEKDYMNHLYHAKRCLYLCVLKNHLLLSSSVEKVEWSALQNEARKPVLVVFPGMCALVFFFAKKGENVLTPRMRMCLQLRKLITYLDFP